MAILVSQGSLQVATAAAPNMLSTVNTSGPFFDGFRRSYAHIYRTQPAVRTVIEFFARNIAQLGLHGFNRVDDTDRQRLSPKHPLSRLIKRPNYATTRYRFIDTTVQDIGTFANGYWWKQRISGPGSRLIGLVRLPAGEVSVLRGALLPRGYLWTPSDGITAPVPIAPDDIVHFRMYDPANPSMGFPPIETLRALLAERAAAANYRRSFWQNGARFETVIERPANAPRWQPNDRQDFRASWQEFSGTGKRAGMTPVLEDGMTIKNISQNFRDAESLDHEKLAREIVAASYHVPQPMVGILEHATFSNIKEQHKQLYQDCLGPWLVGIEEDVELQLVPEFEDLDPDTFYLEFNIAEKLKGSFEEQADSISKLTGKPVMTTNEGRARLNLPRDTDPDSDRIATVSPGQGQTFGGGSSRGANDPEALAGVLRSHATRQSTRLAKDAPDVRAATFMKSADRWARELGEDLAPILGEARGLVIAGSITQETHALLVRGVTPWTSARIESLVAELA